MESKNVQGTFVVNKLLNQEVVVFPCLHCNTTHEILQKPHAWTYQDDESIAREYIMSFKDKILLYAYVCESSQIIYSITCTAIDIIE